MCCGGTVGRMRSLPPMPKVFARWSASPKRFAGVLDHMRGFPVDPPVKSERKALSGGRTSFVKRDDGRHSSIPITAAPSGGSTAVSARINRKGLMACTSLRT
jgi:hypothetical protein